MTAAEKNRDAAIDQVSGSWTDLATAKFDSVKNSLPEKLTGEDIRLELTKLGLLAPHHHNAWGALIMKLVRSERLLGTNEYVSMKDPKSHARRTRVYIRS